MKPLVQEIDEFIEQTGLSGHRVGILLAKNGRLVRRLRKGGRIWPETEEKVRESLMRERLKRNLSIKPQYQLTAESAQIPQKQPGQFDRASPPSS